MSDSGIISIHGKEYHTVAKRVSDFRNNKEFEGWSIRTSVIENNDSKVIIKCVISNQHHRKIATGYAEEYRSASGVNSTSALENAETSAVGRALAFVGLGGIEIASADEAADAMIKQAKNDALKWFAGYQKLVCEHISSIHFIKDALALQQFDEAIEAWRELSEDDQIALWVAPTKGGIFTTLERDQLKEPSKYKDAMA